MILELFRYGVLTLESTIINNTHNVFLDLEVKLENDDILHKTYNKTDDYNFQVVRYPAYDSNISYQLCINTIHGEIIRLYRNSSQLNDFIDRIKQLCTIFKDNEFMKSTIETTVERSLLRLPTINLKFNVTVLQLLQRVKM